MTFVLIFLHFVLATLIVCLVIVQRSAESSVLVSTPQFAPGVANKLLNKITQILVFSFVVNCIAISYIKYHGKSSDTVSGVNTTQTTTTKGIPVD